MSRGGTTVRRGRGGLREEQAKTSYVPPYFAAVLHAGLGEKDKAFERLDQAARDRSALLVYLRRDPLPGNLRSGPRFGTLLRRIRLPG